MNRLLRSAARPKMTGALALLAAVSLLPAQGPTLPPGCEALRVPAGNVLSAHVYALGFQMALNGYAMTMKAWNALKPDQQTKVAAAFRTLTDDIWKYSQELAQDAVNCNAGVDPCTTGKKFKLVNVAVKPSDIEVVRKSVGAISVPTWAEICDKSNPGCSAAWKQTVGKVIGVQ